MSSLPRMQKLVHGIQLWWLPDGHPTYDSSRSSMHLYRARTPTATMPLWQLGCAGAVAVVTHRHRLVADAVPPLPVAGSANSPSGDSHWSPESVSRWLIRTPMYACVHPGSMALVKTAWISNWQTSKTCRSACMWSASHITGMALTVR